MLEKTLIFLLFLGPLIFFHELGHFFFARLFGVRVEVFSIGFGPKVLKWKRGATQFAISIIPLGGYVKMFGDDPFSEKELTEQEKKDSYVHKSSWAKFWIVFGGPLANFILAYFLFVGLSMYGERVPEIRFGELSPISQYYQAGLRTGDFLVKVENQKIATLDDFGLLPREVKSITVKRGEKEQSLSLSKAVDSQTFLHDFIRLSSSMVSPVFYNDKGEAFVLSSNPKAWDKSIGLYHLQETRTSGTDLYLLPLQISNTNGRKTYQLSENFTPQKIQLDFKRNLAIELEKKNLFRNDLFIASVMMNSAAEAAGLKRGDIIRELNGKTVSNFSHFTQLIKNASTTESSSLIVLRNLKEVKVNIMPKIVEVEGKKVPRIGVESGAIMVPPRMVARPGKGLFESLFSGLHKTWSGVAKTLIGFKKIVSSEVPLDSLGGPVAIAQVASDTFAVGFGVFLRFMAMISINLGVINLFPIPVLDGGHLVIIAVEAIKRGRLSKKKLLFAQQLGMGLLFALIFLALFNDISRLVS